MAIRLSRLRTLVGILAVLASAAIGLHAAEKGNRYEVRNLVSDGTIPAAHIDPNLVNAWGLTASATSPWWVANNETATSTLYDADGNPRPLVVQVPGAPTGIVFNGGAGFVVTNGASSGPARFIFASEDGTISGWNPGVAPTQAVVGFTATDGANYKGLTLAHTSNGDFLYAADFHNAKVDVIDSAFQLVSLAGAFVDPNLPDGFAPFGIQVIGDSILVAYAKQDAGAEDEVTGEGLGFVSAFRPDGAFITRVASRGALNAPWGIALAPADFGRFGGDLLIGNFGNGRINVYDAQTFEPRGHLKGTDGKAVVIDGLWGIGFGNGAAAGARNVLYFAAGPDDETHGLFGSIRAVAEGDEPGHRHSGR